VRSSVPAAARAIAAETAQTLRTELRLLKVARVVSAALRVLEAADMLITMSRLFGMTQSALARR
jgi:hypothetical protein